jgi:beta-glucanase (GH16 family)
MLKRVLLASTAVLVCASASAQTQTFNSTNLEQWPLSYPWAPNGILGAQLSSWWPGSGQIPPNANTVSHAGGNMTLSVIPRPADLSASATGGANLIGALVTTHDTFSQTYGYFQLIAQMPATAGTMGAFWLIPESGAWPPEIDVVEALANSPTMLATTAHSTTQSAQEQSLTTVANLTTGFHTYAVDWEADTVTWYFDGQQVYQIATPADMHVPMYMLLDVGAGTPGSWEGAPPSNSVTAVMTVQSVRVWTSNPHLPPTAIATAAPMAPVASPPVSEGALVPAQQAADATPPLSDQPDAPAPSVQTPAYAAAILSATSQPAAPATSRCRRDHRRGYRADHDQPHPDWTAQVFPQEHTNDVCN